MAPGVPADRFPAQHGGILFESAMKTLPRVFVLILNYNGRDMTIECVESVLKSGYPDFRVLVIDNGSTDGSVRVLRARFGDAIDYVENHENLGYSGGFNAGLEYAFMKKQADYCLVMNNDTVLDHRAIAELVNAAQTDHKIGFATGKVYFHDRPDTLQTVGKKEDPVRWNGDHIGYGEIDRGQYDDVAERIFTDDIYTLVSRRMYLDIGGYSTMFFLQGEEYDWQARAKRKGYRIMYVPQARLWHKVSMTLGKSSSKKAYYDARNPMLVVLLHQSPEFFRRYFRHHTGQMLVTALRSIKNLRVDNAYMTIRGYLSGIAWALKNRRLTAQYFL
jgi:GT2 family glycosyltransferase